jgi:CcmD family protein
VNLFPPADLPSGVYLISAYAFAIVVLGGYLVWSLRRLRELERKRPER